MGGARSSLALHAFCSRHSTLAHSSLARGALQDRRRLALFTSSVTVSELKLVVKKETREASIKMGSLLAQPFMPFNLSMWMGLVGTLLYVGYAMYTLDASGYESDDEDEDEDMGLARSMAKDSLEHLDERKLARKVRKLVSIPHPLGCSPPCYPARFARMPLAHPEVAEWITPATAERDPADEEAAQVGAELDACALPCHTR